MIKLVPYNPSWPAQFEEEAFRIQEALGSLALRVEHVGSTAVAGLVAKPVIDIQVTVPVVAPLSCYSEQLAHISYTFVPLGEFDAVYPFFCKPEKWPSTHHVHLCGPGSDEERDHLAFRDYLRDHPATAEEYLALKRTLASKHHGKTLESRERYSLSKTEFVLSVLQSALAEGYPLLAYGDA